jgi:uncharacterized membrane protein (DUF4010 family)
MIEFHDIRSFGVALAIGLMLGFEREHHEWHDHARDQPAGTRTFAVLSVAGALCASIDRLVIAAGLLSAALLIAVGYWRSGPESLGLTTEVSALASFLLGALSLTNDTLAVSVASALALLLVSKQRMRRLVREVVTSEEVADVARWFVLAFVVLPLLPDKGYGPAHSMNPTRIWELVLLLTGVGWFGYIATRAVGERHGLLVVGATGGFVSGAATTLSLARIAKTDPALRTSALGGALLAGVATCVQLTLMTWIALPRFGQRMVGPMMAGALALLATAWFVDRSGRSAEPLAAGEPLSRRPLALKGSLVAAAILAMTIGVSRILVDRIGTSVALAVTAASGLADAHSASLSAVALVRDDVISRSTGVGFVGAALAANTVTKLVAAAVAGGR